MSGVASSPWREYVLRGLLDWQYGEGGSPSVVAVVPN
jgi:hypothetical protein